MEDGNGRNVFLPDNSLRRQKERSTRQRCERAAAYHRNDIFRTTNHMESILGQHNRSPATRQHQPLGLTKQYILQPQKEVVFTSIHNIVTNFNSLLYHNCKNTTNSSELFSQDASHTATRTVGSHPRTLLMQRTHLRRVRLLMVSGLSRASTGPGIINEQASKTTSTSNTATSTLHVAHPGQTTIAMGGQPLGGPAIAIQTDRTKTGSRPWTKSRRSPPRYCHTPAHTSDSRYTEAEEGRKELKL